MAELKLKYWLATTEFPPIHGGGISTYCWHTAKMMESFGHEVTVIIYSHEVKGIQINKISENTTLVQFDPDESEIIETLGFEARLSYEFANTIEYLVKKNGKPDILEFQDYLGIGYYTLQKKQLLYDAFKDLKIIVTLHAPVFLYYEYNQVPLYQFPEYWICEMEKSSIRQADLVISPSNYLIQELESRMVLDGLNLKQIFNPYKNDWSDGELAKYEQGDLVFFGKLTPQKGAVELLSYFKNLWDSGFDKTLTIIGGGKHFFYPFNEDLLDFIKRKYGTYIEKGLLKFEGNMPPKKLKVRLQKAHIIIIPSIVDNLPYAVLEALSLGKIVLASKNGGHIEIIEHLKSGFLFDHNIPHDFQKQLKMILNMNRTETDDISRNSQKIVTATTNYKKIYEEKIKEIKTLINQNTSPKFRFNQPIKKQEFTLPNTTFEKGLLSIIVPYFNMETFIEETLESLKHIKYKNHETLVINDGSTNTNSLAKLESLQSKYDFEIINKENEGLALTRNFGANIAKGEYIAFLDADDTVEPSYYSKALCVLDHHQEISFVGCWAQYFGASKGTWPTFNPEPPYLLIHNVINSSAIIVRKEDFVNFGLNDAKMVYGMEDYDSIISMVKNGARGVVLPEFLWNYRIRKDSMQQSFTENKQLMLYRELSKKHKDFFNQYGAEISNLLNHNGPGMHIQNPTLSKSKLKQKFEKLFGQKAVKIVKKNKIMRDIAKYAYKKMKK